MKSRRPKGLAGFFASEEVLAWKIDNNVDEIRKMILYNVTKEDEARKA